MWLWLCQWKSWISNANDLQLYELCWEMGPGQPCGFPWGEAAAWEEAWFYLYLLFLGCAALGTIFLGEQRENTMWDPWVLARSSIPSYWELLSQRACLLLAWQDVVIGDLKPGTPHRVSVGAYSWAGKGRPSMPREVTTLSQGNSACRALLHSWQGTCLWQSHLASLMCSITVFHWYFSANVGF